jgi:glycosyltransferase involved in cell wall biosynthesis
MKTKNVLFNVVTRASRKNYFKLCYDSIHNQTYKKFRHIVTYETEEMREYLEQFDDLILVKVPYKRTIPGLLVCWRHNPATEGYLNPDHDFLDYRAINREETWGDSIYTEDRIEIEQKVIETPVRKGINKWLTGTHTWREYAKHAPYNWYLKIAEKEFQDGWVVYVDDDDQLAESTVLEKLNKTIVDYGSEDVLHINQFTYPNGDLVPDEDRVFLYSHGFPFVHRQVSTVCLCYHTKYADYTYWDEWSSADFRTAISLREKIPNLNMTGILAVRLTNGTNGGSTEDKEL